MKNSNLVILQVNKFYFMNGGSEKYMFDLSDLLKRHGHEIIPFSMQDERNFPSEFSDFFVTNVNYRQNGSLLSNLSTGLKALYSFEARSLISKLLERREPHIAHLHNFCYQLTPSILAPLRKMDIPIIQTLHDYHMICPSHHLYDFNRIEVCEDCGGKHFYRSVKRKCLKSSAVKSLIGTLEAYLYTSGGLLDSSINLFISPSNFLREKLIHAGIHRDKIKTVPNFVHAKNMEPRYENQGYVLYFGRLEAFKGISTLLKAMQSLGRIPLLVVGSGSLESELRSFIMEDRLDHVKMLGFRSGRELEDLIKNALLTVIPSEWYENCPMSILESFAYGKPVIASRMGGMPELVIEGETGYLFEAGNVEDLSRVLRYAAEHPGEVKDMGVQARRKVEQDHDAEGHYSRIMHIYEDLLK